MDELCNVFIIVDYNYDKDMETVLNIANEKDTNHGDIICGTDYHMCSTSLIYKQNNEIKIIKAIDLDLFPSTVYNVPTIISKFIKNPQIFYKELLNESESLFYQDTFISYVKLSEEHEDFIKKFVTHPIDFSNYNYSINFNKIFIKNKKNYYDIKTFDYN